MDAGIDGKRVYPDNTAIGYLYNSGAPYYFVEIKCDDGDVYPTTYYTKLCGATPEGTYDLVSSDCATAPATIVVESVA
jgi:hypothetical protein